MFIPSDLLEKAAIAALATAGPLGSPARANSPMDRPGIRDGVGIHLIAPHAKNASDDKLKQIK